MNILNKRRNPFKVLGLRDGEMSLRKIENAYRNMRKNLDDQLSQGNSNHHFTHDDLEKAFQELIGYADEDTSTDSEEVVISASFLPIYQHQDAKTKEVNDGNIIYMYKENQQANKNYLKENISRPIDSLMNMKNSSKRVIALSAKNPELIQSLEKIISGTEIISGNLLKILREKMSVSVEEMSNKIKVSKIYLEAIECDSFEKLPAEVYAKGFFNSYLNYIGLDRKDLIEALMEVYRAKKRLIKKV